MPMLKALGMLLLLVPVLVVLTIFTVVMFYALIVGLLTQLS